jgi:LCCL domain
MAAARFNHMTKVLPLTVLLALTGALGCDDGDDDKPDAAVTTDGPVGPSDGPADVVVNVVWNEDAAGLAVGATKTVQCAPSGLFDAVYGTDIYTADSSICTAALHSNLFAHAAGGSVTVQVVDGRTQYLGSTRNGVTTNNWGQYATSFQFMGAVHHTDAGVGDAGRGLPLNWAATANHLLPGQQITYRCTAGTPGVVYGTDIYTGDSSICTAAVHAGKTTAAGGTDFIIEQVAGQAMYTASTRNGVMSRMWGAYDRSFRFVDGP